jgi:23S rRNA-/tRNA-specific pseudouridylate synthase
VDSVEGGIGKHRMPKGYFTTPLPQGNRHTSSGGNAGPSRKQLKFVHQLDAPTSGLLCLSFSRDVAARLGHCFQMRKSVKVYSAILFGWVGEEGGDQDGGANGNGGQTIEGGETGSRSGHGAASRGTPSHDRNVVFEGIPTPLNDYLASAPNNNTLESSDAVGMLKPLSPFAALYDPSSTTTTTVVLEGGGGVDETTTVSASPILTSPSPPPHLLPPNTLINIEAPIGNDPAEGSTLMTIGGNNPRDASSLLQVVKRGYVTLPIPSSSSSSPTSTYQHPTGQDASDASGSSNNSSSGVVVKATHVLLRLYTGRRHQLRLHCRHIGHPIVGDASYVSEVPLNAKVDTNTSETMSSQSSARSSPPVLAERMYLHAWRLAFFDSFEVGDHGKRERVEARKKRRRESLGINNRGGGGVEDGTEVTGVATGPDPFAHLVVD